MNNLQSQLLNACFRGWDVSELNMQFASWLAENKISKADLEAYVSLALENEVNIDDPIAYNLTDDCLDLIYVVNEEEDEMYKIWFDGFRFENWVGSKEVAWDSIVKGPGQTEVISASEWLEEYWEEEAYDFIINNWRYAEIEKL